MRESLQQEGDSIHFALLCKTADNPNWQTLVEVVCPRLKPARLAAYEIALSPLVKTSPTP